MANTKKEIKLPETTDKGKKEFFTHEQLRFIFGILLCLLALYTFVTLVSYLFTWDTDQSLLQNHETETDSETVENYGGSIGFRWANLLIGNYFGLAAFFVPVLILLLGFYLLRIKWFPLLKSFIVTLTGLILFSVFLSFVFGYTPWYGLFGNGPGGMHGFHVSRWLISMLGAAGTALLLLFLLLTWGILVNKRFVYLLKNIGKYCISCFKRKHKKPEQTRKKENKP
jgi:S-DNA-T family DNA segregation ATPase FtsK/SpoIIIE